MRTRSAKRALAILGAILGVLVILFLISRAVGVADDADETTAQSYVAATLPESKTVGVDITLRDDETESRLVLSRSDGDGEWIWDENPELPIDSSALSRLANMLDGLDATHRISGVAESDLGKYGLDVPCVVLRISFENGEQKNFALGDRNPFNGEYYFCDLDDKSSVYMIVDDYYAEFALDVTDVIKYDTVPVLNKGAVTKITFCGRDFVPEYDGDGKLSSCLISDGETSGNASSDALSHIGNLLGLYFYDAVDCSGDRSPYGIGEKLTFAYTADGEEKLFVLAVGDKNAAGCAYVTVGDSVPVYVLPKGVSDALTSLASSKTEDLVAADAEDDAV